MADIDQIIAGGAGASSRADFSGLGTLLDNFYKGRDQKYQQEGRDLFKNGVPTDADGQPDFAAMGKSLFQHGDIKQGVEAANLGLQQQRIQEGRDEGNFIATGQTGPSRSAIVSPPSSNRTASSPVAPPLNRGGVEQPGNNAPQGGATIMQVLTAQGIPNDQLGAAGASIARQLGLSDPNAQLNLQDPQVRNILGPAVAQLKRAGIGQVVPGQPQQPQQQQPQAPQLAQAQPQPQPQPQAPQGQPSPFDNAIATGLIPPGTDPRMYVAKLKYIQTASQNPAAVRSATDQLNAINEAGKLTSEQRDFNAASGNPKLNEFTNQKAAEGERAKAIAGNDVKEQQLYIDNGRAAQTRLGTLNTMSNILDTDKKMNLGFGAETALKLKMAAEAAGFDVGDLSGPQLLQKLGAALASESTKALATRPTQFEFKTFLANNPGLLLDAKGNARMIGILAQNTKREVELGKLARQNRDNWDNWDNVVEAYDKKNPIKDPTTGKVLSNHTIIAPASASPTNKSASSTIASKAEYDKLPSGTTFTGPDGKPWRKP